LAARRLGADVALVGAPGADPAADEALALLAAGGVDLAGVRRVPELPTGHALITVDDDGETTIVVAAGANAQPVVEPADVRGADAVLSVLEVPDAAVAAAATGLVVLNAAPARPVAADVLRRVDVVVVNAAEYAELDGLDTAGAVVITHGGDGAELRRAGVVVATATPPPTTVVDGTGAGDCFTTALTVALLAGRSDALCYACAAGALAVSRTGAQPSLPTAAELEAVL
jgi:ribokinase